MGGYNDVEWAYLGYTGNEWDVMGYESSIYGQFKWGTHSFQQLFLGVIYFRTKSFGSADQKQKGNYTVGHLSKPLLPPPPFDSQHPLTHPRSQHVAEMGEDVVALGFPLGQNSLKISKGAHEKLQKGHPQIGLLLIQKL